MGPLNVIKGFDMKNIKSILFLLSILIFSLNSSGVIANSDGVLINIETDPSSFTLNKSNNINEFYLLQANNYQTRKIDGLPMVPEKVIFITGEGALDEINVQFNEEVFKKGLKVDFFRGEKCRCRPVEDLSFNNSLYLSDKKGIRIESFGDFRGQKLYKVSVSVARQSDQGVSFYRSIQVKIPKSFTIVENILNFGSSSEKEKTLVLTTPEFEKVVNKAFAADYFSERDISISVVGNSQSKDQIKALIKQGYEADQITTAILIGSENIIPTYIVDTKFDTNTPSDLYYGTFGGSGDYIPDVFISRISVENSPQLEAYFKKLDTVKGKLKIKNTLGIASNEGASPSDKEYIRQMIGELADSKNASTLYLDQDNSNSNSDTFNTKFESGVNWVNYIGHGSGYSWSSFNQEYFVDDINQIKSQSDFPVLVDVACQNGRFSNEGRIGESLIFGGSDNKLVGAVLYYGGSVDISWHPPAIMAVGIGKYLTKNSNIPVYRALLAGHLYLMENSSNQEDIVDNLEWYHLQGDPGILIL